MLKICLSRVGKKKQPSYRVLVVEKQKDPLGSYLENVGRYDPLSKPKRIEFKKDRILYWLSVGAEASATVHNLLVSAGVIEGKKRKASKNKKVVATTATASAPAQPTPAPEAASVAVEAPAA